MAAAARATSAGATALFEAAAAHSHAGAMFALAAIHRGGHGLPRTAARRCAGRAPPPNSATRTPSSPCRAGSPRARRGPAEAAEARKWLTPAADQGLAEARDELAGQTAPAEPTAIGAAP